MEIGEIELRCVYSFGPGCEWSAGLRLVATCEGFDVYRENSQQLWEHTERVPWLLIASVKQELTWRSAAECLVSIDSDYAMPGEVAIPGITVKGATGWQEDMLKLCWSRWGDDKEENYGADLLTLEDEALQVLYGHYRSLTPSYSRDAGDFLGDYEQIKQSQGQRARLSGSTLHELLSEFEIATDPTMFSDLIEKLDAEPEDSQGITWCLGYRPR